MTPQSAKEKGRRLQKKVRDKILEAFPSLEEDDVRSTAMGQGGEDIQLSPAARRLFPYSVECKNKASWAVYTPYDQAVANCPSGSEPILVIQANRKKPLVILDLDYFMSICSKGTRR